MPEIKNTEVIDLADLVKAGRGPDRKKRKSRGQGWEHQSAEEEVDERIDKKKRVKSEFPDMFEEAKRKFQKSSIISLDADVEKARPVGAKDKQPRRRRGAVHNVLVQAGYEKSPLSHPKVSMYHKLDSNELVMVRKEDGAWSHYNESGFHKEGRTHEELRSHIAKK